MDKSKTESSLKPASETSALQRYLERQKNLSNPPASVDFRGIPNLRPQFGVNSAYFMWILESATTRAQAEFNKWKSRRLEAKLSEEARAEKLRQEDIEFAVKLRLRGHEGLAGTSAIPGQLAVDPLRPLTWVHAEFGVRFLSTVIDWIVIYIIWKTISNYVSLPFVGESMSHDFSQDMAQGISRSFVISGLPTSFFTIWTLLAIPYYGFFYTQKGASIGKLALGLEVIDARTGRYLSFWSAILRETIGKTFSFAICMIGFLMAALRYDHRAFHDLLFETVVVRVPPLARIKPPGV